MSANRVTRVHYPLQVIAAGTKFYMDSRYAGALGSFQVSSVINTTAKTTASTNFNTTTKAITITAHGFFTGQVVQLTTSGALGTGLALATNYFIFVCDVNTVQLFDTLADAVAATGNGTGVSVSTGLIAFTTQGSGNATFTPTTISGLTTTMQWSNDFIPNPNGGTPINAGTWTSFVAGESNTQITNTISSTGTTGMSIKSPSYNWISCTVAIAAGTVNMEIWGKCC